MKTANSPGAGPAAFVMCLLRRSAVVTVALAALSSNLLATTVSWITGGPNIGYPSGAGYVDGDLTSEAEFHTPRGLAIDESGNYLLVADRDNNTVRVLTFDINAAGTLLTYTNYVVDTNIFSQPVGVAIDSSYNTFVLNRAHNTNGTVLEFDYTGELIATNLAHITNAGGIALDPYDNIYVTASNQVLEVTYTNTVNVIATITATNSFLQGIVVKHNGLLAVCDTGRNGILLINPSSGLVTTNAGFHGQGDFITQNDTAYSNTATFFQPSGIAESGDGTLIVTDFGNDRVKAVLANGNVTNVYGVSSNDWVSPYPGFSDGTTKLPDGPGGVAARGPFGVVVAPDGSLYTSEDYYHIIQHVTGANFIPQPPQPPVPPASLTATLITNVQTLEIVLNWSVSASGNVTNYIVETSTTPGGGGPYSILASTGTTTTYTDSNPTIGATNYFVIVAVNGGGQSPNSPQASVFVPTPPPPAPTIGWFDYEFNGTIYTSVLHPVSGTYISQNDLTFAILPNIAGVNTFYLAGPTPVTNNPTSGGTAPPYANGTPFPGVTALPVTTVPNLTIAAENVNGEGEASPVVSVQVLFECGNPSIIGTNAAQFQLIDNTTNVTYYYTTDGTSPLTNTPPSQIVVATNGTATTISINDSSTFAFEVVAERGGYAASAVETNIFFAQNFHANELTWGFQSGYCSSEFIASPGETFYAPVTMSSLPGTVMYAMDFDMVVTNLGPHPVPTGAFNFQPMIQKLIDGVYYPIPPYMFAGDASSPPPPSQLVNYEGTNFVNLEVYNTNLNELAVGWFEIYGETNLYNTLQQNLLTYSLAFIGLIPSGAFPNEDIVGGYTFSVPTNAQPGEQYEIQLNRASANGDGLGGPDSAVPIELPLNGALTNGAINAIKIVTVGQPKYMAGDLYPFSWFNAGDFGFGDLTNYGANDVEATFNAAVYAINNPADNEPGSDFADAMDSAGGFGTPEGTTGYWIPAGTLSTPQKNALFNVNDATTINEMAFGDGVIDICDVWTTFVRSQFPNLYWFQRFYTNDTVNGVFGRVAAPIYPQTNVDGNAGFTLPGVTTKQLTEPVSITNTPAVNFFAGDYLASAGQTISIPIAATVFGPNPMRMLMLNVAIVPLDGSPAITAAPSFTLNAPFNNSSIFNPPGAFGTADNSHGNYALALLPKTIPIPTNACVTGSNVVGYINVTIPASATSSSAYAVHFDHASASPNGLVSFPKTTYTGLITLSSRNSSYYNDGIPDSWRLRYFGTIYNQLSVSNADADGTGMNNWQKYKAGLNPMDATSVLKAGSDQPMAQGPQDMVLYWPSVSGQTYIVERSSTLFPAQWTAISTNIGDGTFMEIHDTSGGNNRYYQVTTP